MADETHSPVSPWIDRPLVRALRYSLAVACVVLGGFGVLLVAAVADCSFAGGRCPSEASWNWEVFGSGAAMTALAVAPTLFLVRPNRRGLLRGVAWAVPAALVVGAPLAVG